MSTSAGVWLTFAQLENNCFTEMLSGSEAGSSLRLIDFMHHLTPGLRTITKKKEREYCTIHANSVLRDAGRVVTSDRKLEASREVSFTPW